jgi:hypothetical protein
MVKEQVTPIRLLRGVIPYVLIGYLYCNFIILQEAIVVQRHPESTATTGHLGYQARGTAPGSSTSTSSSSSNSIIQTLKDRVQMLETKLDTYLGYNSDPFLWTKVSAQCKNMSKLNEFCGPESCNLDMNVCLDNFPYNDCIVYDFGIREQPGFGVVLTKPPFNCKVYAFDPSPITRKWFETNDGLKQNPNYHLFHYGGGGADEVITLREYNWNQVSIYSYPKRIVANPRNCTNSCETATRRVGV